MTMLNDYDAHREQEMMIDVDNANQIVAMDTETAEAETNSDNVMSISEQQQQQYQLYWQQYLNQQYDGNSSNMPLNADEQQLQWQMYYQHYASQYYGQQSNGQQPPPPSHHSASSTSPSIGVHIQPQQSSYGSSNSTYLGWQGIKAIKRIRPEDIDLPTIPHTALQEQTIDGYATGIAGGGGGVERINRLDQLSSDGQKTRKLLEMQLKFSKKNLDFKNETAASTAAVVATTTTKPIKVSIKSKVQMMQEKPTNNHPDLREHRIEQKHRDRNDRSTSQSKHRSNQ